MIIELIPLLHHQGVLFLSLFWSGILPRSDPDSGARLPGYPIAYSHLQNLSCHFIRTYQFVNTPYQYCRYHNHTNCEHQPALHNDIFRHSSEIEFILFNSAG